MSLSKRLMVVILLFHLSAGHISGQSWESQVRDAKWSPDGQYLAVANGGFSCGSNPESYSIDIVDVTKSQTIKQLIGLGHTCGATSLAWRPNGLQLLSSSEDGNIILWDITTGQKIYQISLGDFGSAGSLSWNHDGSRYAAINYLTNRAMIRDGITGEEISMPADFQGTTLETRHSFITWSPNGQRIATTRAHASGIQIWNTSGILLLTLDTPSQMRELAWSPDGLQLAGSDDNEMLSVWTVETQHMEWSVVVEGNITSIDWRPGGKFIAIGTQILEKPYYAKAPVYDAFSGDLVSIFNYPGPVYTVDWEPSGIRLAYGGNRLDGHVAPVVQIGISLLTAEPLPTSTP